jgi:transcription initiation factor TFIIIB Brf1 subunit/transcription initiation factor TFIIB
VLSIDKENILDICYKLNLDEETASKCNYYYNLFSSKLPENTKKSILAGVIYFVTQSNGLNVSKKNINETTGVSVVTINKIYKKIINYPQFSHVCKRIKQPQFFDKDKGVMRFY